MTVRRISITYFDRARYVLQTVTPMIETDNRDSSIYREVVAHAPGSAISAEVLVRQGGEPFRYDLARLPNRVSA